MKQDESVSRRAFLATAAGASLAPAAPAAKRYPIGLEPYSVRSYVVMASAGKVDGLDGWKRVAERLSQAAVTMKPAKLRPGYHNRQAEFKALEGSRPIDIIARNTGKGYRVLFGDGAAPWKEIFEAVEKSGGLEYYTVEQEGSDLSELETAQRCLESFKRLHG